MRGLNEGTQNYVPLMYKHEELKGHVESDETRRDHHASETAILIVTRTSWPRSVPCSVLFNRSAVFRSYITLLSQTTPQRLMQQLGPPLTNKEQKWKARCAPVKELVQVSIKCILWYFMLAAAYISGEIKNILFPYIATRKMTLKWAHILYRIFPRDRLKLFP